MPELPSGVANLYLRCSSKSPGLPLFQTRKVCLDLSFVSWPLMTPSLTVQYSSSPSQPVRSLPLKMVMKPSASGFGRSDGIDDGGSAAATSRARDSTHGNETNLSMGESPATGEMVRTTGDLDNLSETQAAGRNKPRRE